MRMLLAGVIAVVAGCRALPASTVNASSSSGLPADSPAGAPAKAIVFAWSTTGFTTSAGPAGNLHTVEEFVPKLVIRDLPEGATVSGDVHEWAREGTTAFFEIAIRAPLAAIAIDARRTRIDPLARFTITLPDGQTGTTSVPPLTLSDRMLWSWFAMHREVTPDTAPLDSMIYFDAERRLEVFGRHGTLGDVDVVAAIDVARVSSAECEYTIPIDRREERRRITVFLNKTSVAIRDRRSDRVLVERSWPAPTGCPSSMTSRFRGRSMPRTGRPSYAPTRSARGSRHGGEHTCRCNAASLPDHPDD